jgi:hypothetical protein
MRKHLEILNIILSSQVDKVINNIEDQGNKIIF